MKSEIKYISYIKSINKWRVTVKINKKRKTLGTFVTIDEAKECLVQNGFSIEKKNGNIKYPNRYIKNKDHYLLIITREDNSEIIVKIDIDDYEKCKSLNWYADCGKNLIYIKSNNHNRFNNYGASILLHRFIMGVDKNNRLTVDHIDGDTLNNTKDNLRFADNTQQLQNQQIRKDNTSGFKNVSYINARGMWRVKFQIKGDTVFDKLYTTKEEAISVSKRVRKELYGEFDRR